MSWTENKVDLELGPGGESWAPFFCPLLQCFERPMALVVVKLESVPSPEEPAQERHEETDNPSRATEESQDENGELDNISNSLWPLYEKAVKSRDKVRIQALRDDMDGVLIFVCIYYLPPVVSSV